MTDKCKVCELDLVLNQDVALACDSCNGWHCYGCMGVDKKIFKLLSDSRVNTSMIKVICKECLKQSNPIHVVSHLSEMKRDIGIQIKDLSDKIEKMKVISEAKHEEAITVMKSHNSEAKVTWAQAVQLNIESSQSIKAVSDAVKVSSSKNIEIAEKDRSIIMFNHPESTKNNSVERKKDDLDFVEKFIEEGLNISAQPVQSCFRLGRYTADKSRPLKVIFCHKVGQIKVLDNLSALRGAQGVYNKVSVCIDRDAAERKVVQELVQKAKKQTEESADKTKKYVVRGTYNPFIQELKVNTA